MSTAEYVTEFARVTEQEGSKELYDVLIKGIKKTTEGKKDRSKSKKN